MAKKALGTEEYKPTRLEWLAVMVNSILPKSPDGRYRAICAAGADEKSIIMSISHDINLDKEFVNKYANDVEDVILAVAEMYGWGSWIEVEKVFSPKDSKKI